MASVCSSSLPDVSSLPSCLVEAAHAAAAAAAAASGPRLAALANILQHEHAIEKVPEPFALSERLENDSGADDSVPIIDLRGVLENREGARSQAAKTLVAACEKWGFFQVINHGISQDIVKQAQIEGSRVFELPAEVKVKSARNLTTKHSGYGTAASTAAKGSLPWSEAFTMMGRPHSNTAECARELWGDDEANQRDEFSKAMDQYIEAMQKLSQLVVELLIEGYGVSREHFDKAFMLEPQETLRLNYYPPCPEPSRTVGLGTHVDTNCFTIVHDGGVAGLQVRTEDGRYIPIASRQDGFAVNVGDMLEVLTCGRSKSVLHRVVVNKEESRLSMAFFVSPSLSSTIFPHPDLIDKSHPQYTKKEFTWGEYYLARRILCTTSSLDEFLNGETTSTKQTIAAY